MNLQREKQGKRKGEKEKEGWGAGRDVAPGQVQATGLEMRERKRNHVIHMQELEAADSLGATSWKDKLLYRNRSL